MEHSERTGVPLDGFGLVFPLSECHCSGHRSDLCHCNSQQLGSLLMDEPHSIGLSEVQTKGGALSQRRRDDVHNPLMGKDEVVTPLAATIIGP